jgi:hypothetical protein
MMNLAMLVSLTPSSLPLAGDRDAVSLREFLVYDEQDFFEEASIPV